MSPFQRRNPGGLSHKYGIQGNNLHVNDDISSCNKLFSQRVFHTMVTDRGLKTAHLSYCKKSFQKILSS